MNTYMKKPVKIQAMQFKYTDEDIKLLKEFCPVIYDFTKERHPDAKATAVIKTLEDGFGSAQVQHIATEGDYIIKGIQGEFYACKPDVFEQTYELVATTPKRSCPNKNKTGTCQMHNLHCSHPTCEQ